MKVKTDNEVYTIPVDSGIHLLVLNERSESVIDCLTNYFVQKKKNKAVVFDNEGDVVNQKEVSFIYYPSSENIETLFTLKPKTTINTELSNLMIHNAESFQSVEYIRNGLEELLTDRGMIKFKKILEKDTGLYLNMDTSNFDLTRLIQSLNIDTEVLKREELYMILYNLLIFLNQNTFNIIYIDFKVTEAVSNWLIKKKNSNNLILINNECAVPPLSYVYDSAIVLSDYDYVETIDVSCEQTGLISYLFHPTVRANLMYQTEKNKNFMSRFDDDSCTFLINFTSDNAQ